MGLKEQFERLHIPSSEIESDIRDTMNGIVQLREQILQREEFIADLRALLAARAGVGKEGKHES